MEEFIKSTLFIIIAGENFRIFNYACEKVRVKDMNCDANFASEQDSRDKKKIVELGSNEQL